MIDVTVDLETCSLAPTAAVMSIGAVAWKRYDKHSPFFEEGNGVLKNPEFSAHVDLRSMFLNGFSFDQSTANWWAQQSYQAKEALLEGDGESAPCQPIDIVVVDFFDWIANIEKTLGDEDVCLWAQGTDFDVAILRNICYKMGIKFKIEHTQFRDHRSVFLELARMVWRNAHPYESFTVEKAYSLVTDYKDIAGGEVGAAHDPLFDCKRSIYSTWKMMQIYSDIFDALNEYDNLKAMKEAAHAV